jgi:hypothetical protein
VLASAEDVVRVRALRAEGKSVRAIAWAYVFLGARLHAILNFKHELALDPKNPIATTMLGELSAKL